MEHERETGVKEEYQENGKNSKPHCHYYSSSGELYWGFLLSLPTNTIPGIIPILPAERYVPLIVFSLQCYIVEPEYTNAWEFREITL